MADSAASRRVLWFRRDLRLLDHPALLAAAGAGNGEEVEVVPLFVLDERLLGPAGPPRVAWFLASVRALADELAEHGATLVVRHGDPELVVPAVVAETGAQEVHISADHGPYGRDRDARVQAALGEVPLVATGSPYAVSPGRVLTGSGTGYQVFTPFYRAWRDHGWRAPATSAPDRVTWASAATEPLPTVELPPDVRLEPGEPAARRHWAAALERIGEYAAVRDRPDLDATSRVSAYLKVGALHPRTLLADLADLADLAGEGAEAFRRELAFREFYADVLHHRPETAREYARPELRGLPYVTGDALREHLDAWRTGQTGYPLVDAGMRQLLAEGWMHNRVRMLVASFLVKDLGVEWTHGARHFLRHLIDGDLASNQHGWQWAAGTGTDAAPYFRIFNPTTQARRFDPDGDYIRRWIPELRSLGGRSIHEPWNAPGGLPVGYPAPIVDHAEQRAAALAGYHALRDRR